MEFLYQINTGQADGTPGLDLNVAEAWELGYTGKGVTIGIMDDGEFFNAFTAFVSQCVFAVLRNIRESFWRQNSQVLGLITIYTVAKLSPSSKSMALKFEDPLNKYLLNL